METDPIHQRRWWTLGVLLLALLVIGIDQTILNVALPRLAGDLSATGSQLQWMVEAYILVFAGLLLTGGALGDRFGRRKALLAGLAIFGMSSFAAALADSAGQLIAARAVMGVGGALIMPTTLSVLTNVFPEDERAKAIGIWAAVSSMGIIVGPLAGGWLLDHYWWGSIFLVNIPIVIVAIVATMQLVPDSRDPSRARLDPGGAVLSTLGLSAVLYAIIEGPVHGWSDSAVVAAALFGTVLMIGFVLWERTRERPMVDLTLFRDPRFAAASAAITLAFFALNGGMFFLTQYLQFVMGYTPLEAGVRVIPIAVGVGIAAPQSARLTERYGAKAVVAAGMFVIAAGLGIQAATAAGATGYGVVLVSLVVIGAGIGIAGTPATDSIMAVVPREQAGVGSAVNDTTREIGGALGVAVLGSVLASSYRNAAADPAHGLPEAAAEIYADSIGGAVAVAEQVGGEAGAGLLDLAHAGFVDAMAAAVAIGVLFVTAGAAIAIRWLPSRPELRDPVPPTTFEPQPVETTAMTSRRGGPAAVVAHHPKEMTCN